MKSVNPFSSSRRVLARLRSYLILNQLWSCEELKILETRETTEYSPRY